MSQVLGQFDGYRFRAIEEKDYARLEEWIAADLAHADTLDPEFFMGEAIDANGHLAPDPRVTALVLTDDEGTELMYVRLTRASRVHIQFAPRVPGVRDLVKQREQLAKALVGGMAFLEVGLARAGCTEWIFESEAAQLRSMVEKRMGFAASPNEMVRIIPRLDAPAQEEA